MTIFKKSSYFQIPILEHKQTVTFQSFLESVRDSDGKALILTKGGEKLLEKLYLTLNKENLKNKEKAEAFWQMLEVNSQLLEGFDHAYMSSGARYMGVPLVIKLPNDGDLAMNGQKILKLTNTLQQNIKLINGKNGYQSVKNVKIKYIDIGNEINILNKVEIQNTMKNGNLKVEYDVYTRGGSKMEVELFPEIGGIGLTNLGKMGKGVQKERLISMDGSRVLDVVFLDPISNAKGYVINMLNEFSSNLPENIGKQGEKIKDSLRLGKIVGLLQEARVVKSMDDVLRFIDDTVGEYRALENKSKYVESGLREYEKVREFLEDTILDFSEIIENSQIGKHKIFNKENIIPELDSWHENLTRNKKELSKWYNDYLEANENYRNNPSLDNLQIKQNTIIILREWWKTVNKDIKETEQQLTNIEGFAHYYEIVRTKKEFINHMYDIVKNNEGIKFKSLNNRNNE